VPRITSVNVEGVKPQIGIHSSAVANKGINAQFEYDVAPFRDPAGQKKFAGWNGTFPEVREWMKEDTRVGVVIKECLLLADDLIKPKDLDNKKGESVSNWLSIAFKDHHGQWASPAVAELVADALSLAGYVVVVYHGSLKKEAVWLPPTI